MVDRCNDHEVLTSTGLIFLVCLSLTQSGSEKEIDYHFLDPRVALAECLDDHEDDVSLLYLTDNEAILQAIHRWIGYGAKLNLSKSPDADVLKKNILKLQKRVQAGAATLLVTVKAHRGDPLNEEADIRAEMRHHNLKNKRGQMEQPNQQHSIPMGSRTNYEIDHMDQHTESGIDSAQKREKSKSFEH